MRQRKGVTPTDLSIICQLIYLSIAIILMAAINKNSNPSVNSNFSKHQFCHQKESKERERGKEKRGGERKEGGKGGGIPSVFLGSVIH